MVSPEEGEEGISPEEGEEGGSPEEGEEVISPEEEEISPEEEEISPEEEGISSEEVSSEEGCSLTTAKEGSVKLSDCPLSSAHLGHSGHSGLLNPSFFCIPVNQETDAGAALSASGAGAASPASGAGTAAPGPKSNNPPPLFFNFRVLNLRTMYIIYYYKN